MKTKILMAVLSLVSATAQADKMGIVINPPAIAEEPPFRDRIEFPGKRDRGGDRGGRNDGDRRNDPREDRGGRYIPGPFPFPDYGPYYPGPRYDEVYLGTARLADGFGFGSSALNVYDGRNLTRVKVRAQRDDVIVRQTIIEFCSDRAQTAVLDFPGGMRLYEGQSSRWLDLPGGVRCIRSVVVVGESRWRGAMVEVIGDRAQIINLASTNLDYYFDEDRLNTSDIYGIRALSIIAAPNSRVRLNMLKVTFCNGSNQFIDLRGETLREGERRTQWYDLVGRERCITKLQIFGSAERGYGRVTIQGLRD